MAPGDKMFYVVSYEGATNKMKSFKTRELANDFYKQMKDETPRIMLAGETGDILMSKGDQN